VEFNGPVQSSAISQRTEELSLDVRGDGTPNQHSRPELDRWLLQQRRRESDRIEIIMEVGTLPAGPRIARCPPPALAPGADAAKVLQSSTHQEDVGAGVEPLCPALQPAPGTGERRQVEIIGSGDEKVGILRIRLVGREGTEQGDTLYASEARGLLDELSRKGEES
jgi:hypothetical protein